MAVAEISTKLFDLHGLLKSSSDSQAAEEAQNVLVDLSHVLLRPLSDADHGTYCIMHLFFSSARPEIGDFVLPGE